MKIIDIKTDLHRLIEQVQDDAILQAVRTILAKQAEAETDFWDELSEGEQQAIEKGLSDLDNGKSYSYEQIRDEVKQKYNI